VGTRESQPASRWDVTPLAQSGTFGFTDSPAGLYRGCPSRCGRVQGQRDRRVRSARDPHRGATLTWDQICITEAGFDFCIVEISSDDGASWSELARYDMNSDPRWADMAAAPGDWRHESIDLSSHKGHESVIRFRLESDSNLEFDGWYVDNVQLNDPACVSAVAVGDPSARRRSRSSRPRRIRSEQRTLRMDASAQRDPCRPRALRRERTGGALRAARRADAGTSFRTWDGRDSQGRTVASGAYYARLTREVRRCRGRC
jgi:hypothetical protein